MHHIDPDWTPLLPPSHPDPPTTQLLCVFRLTIPVHVDSATEELTLDLSDPW